MTMNIAITGHTTGLGKSLFDFYTNQGHYVTGFSRSNDFDLRNWDRMQALIDATEFYDLIFSNAKPDFFQTVFLYEFARREKFNSKIVSIGSRIIHVDVPNTLDIGINLYKTQKLALQNAHHQLIKRYQNFKSILIHPAHLYDNNVQNPNLIEWVKNMDDTISMMAVGEINLG